MTAGYDPDADYDDSHPEPESDLPERTYLDPIFAIPVSLDDPLLSPKAAYADTAKGEPMSFRTAERQNRDIDVMLQNVPGLPWKTRTDFYRAGGYFLWQHTIRSAKAGHPKLRQRSLEEQLTTDAHDNAESSHRLQQLLIDVHNYLTTLINQHALGEIYRVLDTYYESIKLIPIEYVRDTYIQSVGSLAAVRLSLALLNASGAGAPPNYIGVLHGPVVPTVSGSRPSLSAGPGLPSGSIGASAASDAGVRDTDSPVPDVEEPDTGHREGSREEEAGDGSS